MTRFHSHFASSERHGGATGTPGSAVARLPWRSSRKVPSSLCCSVGLGFRPLAMPKKASEFCQKKCATQGVVWPADCLLEIWTPIPFAEGSVARKKAEKG